MQSLCARHAGLPTRVTKDKSISCPARMKGNGLHCRPEPLGATDGISVMQYKWAKWAADRRPEEVALLLAHRGDKGNLLCLP